MKYPMILQLGGRVVNIRDLFHNRKIPVDKNTRHAAYLVILIVKSSLSKLISFMRFKLQGISMNNIFLIHRPDKNCGFKGSTELWICNIASYIVTVEELLNLNILLFLQM